MKSATNRINDLEQNGCQPLASGYFFMARSEKGKGERSKSWSIRVGRRVVNGRIHLLWHCMRVCTIQFESECVQPAISPTTRLRLWVRGDRIEPITSTLHRTYTYFSYDLFNRNGRTETKLKHSKLLCTCDAKRRRTSFPKCVFFERVLCANVLLMLWSSQCERQTFQRKRNFSCRRTCGQKMDSAV